MAKQNNPQNATGWTSTQAYLMAVICLVIGVAVGYLLRGSGVSQPGTTAATPGAAPTGMGMPQQQPGPEQLKQVSDAQAAPLLARLKSAPNDASLLADLGNVYYDAQQYRDAINYYERSLKIQPNNTNVRTDLGTALWYSGDPDKAIEQFNAVLKIEPTKANALMNLGVVQWQGKMNSAAAIAAWEKLLATNPNYENRAQVEQLMAQAKKHSNVKPGMKTDKPAM